jgi:hypothetical protein
LGEVVTLNSTITVTQTDIFNVTFNIVLPEGFELISSELPWEGDIITPEKTSPPWNETNQPAKTSISFISQIKAVQEGNWTVTGVLFFIDGKPMGGIKPEQYGKLYVSVSKHGSYIRETPFSDAVEPCVEEYIDGELVRCGTKELGDFIETET